MPQLDPAIVQGLTSRSARNRLLLDQCTGGEPAADDDGYCAGRCAVSVRRQGEDDEAHHGAAYNAHAQGGQDERRREEEEGEGPRVVDRARRRRRRLPEGAVGNEAGASYSAFLLDLNSTMTRHRASRPCRRTSCRDGTSAPSRTTRRRPSSRLSPKIRQTWRAD